MGFIGKVLGNRLYLSVVGVIAILIFGLFYLFAAVLDRPLTETPVGVTVELEAAGGLFEGSAVTYRGVKVGKVVDVVKSDDGAKATLRLNAGTEIPADTNAKVRSLSPIGEQYLDFQPNVDGAPFLQDGATVEATHTDIPKSLGSTVVAIDNVLSQIDDRKLELFLKELSVGLDGTGDDIGSLVDQGALIVNELDRIYPQTERLLRNAGPVLSIATDNATTLRDLAVTSKQFARFLREYDPELRRMLDRAPGQLATVEGLVSELDGALPEFLSTAVSLTDVFRMHDPHLRRLLQAYSPGLGILADGIKNDQIQLELILAEDPRCDYGHQRQAPRDATRRELFRGGHCSASFATLQRGAAHAPGPVR